VCDFKTYSGLYLDQAKQYRDIDVTSMVKKAQQSGKKQIAFCLSGDSAKQGIEYTFGPNNTHYSSQMIIMGEQ